MLNHLEDFYIKRYDSIDNGYNIASGSPRCNPEDTLNSNPQSEFKILNDEMDRFILTHINPILQDSKEDKLCITKLKTILKLVSNIDVDYKFLIDILERLDIEVFAEIPIESKYFDKEVYGSTYKYTDIINHELAIEMIKKDPNISIFIYKKIKTNKSLKEKIYVYNK